MLTLIFVLPEARPCFDNSSGATKPSSFDRWWHRRVAEPATPVPQPAGVWDALLGGDNGSIHRPPLLDDTMSARWGLTATTSARDGAVARSASWWQR